MAQAHAMLGSKVTIVEAGPEILGPADAEVKQILLDEFTKYSIDVITNAKVTKACQSDGQVTLTYQADEQQQTVSGTDLLVATGRVPNIQHLGLDQADVNYDARGVAVSARLRTNQKHIYAIGDIASPYQFTHTAGYHAGIVIQNMLFKLPAKVNYSALPWSIYTTPEIAHTGQSLQQAKKNGARIIQRAFSENDRACAMRQTQAMRQMIAHYIKDDAVKKSLLGSTRINYQSYDWNLNTLPDLKNLNS